MQVLFDCCLKHGKPFQFLYLLVHVQILNYHSCEWVFSSVHTKQFLTLSMFYYRVNHVQFSDLHVQISARQNQLKQYCTHLERWRDE
ncbi:hypothetical protein CY35_10G013100 [Sphagnum magellanicum]|nr:hypothetical protein CY35_10G013100 [Sphagnum magellanicum]